MIATGAGKILSSVFFSDSSSSSSSSDDLDDSNNENDISSPGDEAVQKNVASEMVRCFINQTPQIAWKSETMRVIEQLLMKETFTREECDRLTNIVKSRVIDLPITADTEDMRPNVAMSDMTDKAVMEARKWLEEKKLGSNSKSKLEHGICSLSSVSHATDDELGSPVDMAKSYMQRRPPWASPSIKHIEFTSPSPVKIQPFGEETPYSVGDNSVSSTKLKRDFLSAGSWNIQEELRRVRSKATEEMLKNLPSSKVDWSAFSLEHRSGLNSLAGNKNEAVVGDKMPGYAKPRDGFLNFAEVSKMMQDGLQNNSFQNPAISSSEHNQVFGANRTTEGATGLRDGVEETLSSTQRRESPENIKTTHSGADAADIERNADGTSQASPVKEGTKQGTVVLALNAIPDTRVHDRNGSTSREGIGDPFISNGFTSSGSREPKPMPSNEENNPASSCHDKVTANTNLEQNCELLSESYMDVPVVEIDNLATGSQNSHCMYQEELSQDLTQPSPKRHPELSHDLTQPTPKSRQAGKARSPVVEKQQGRKLGGYNRRAKSRGK